jgi:hypothetical protein
MFFFMAVYVLWRFRKSSGDLVRAIGELQSSKPIPRSQWIRRFFLLGWRGWKVFLSSALKSYISCATCAAVLYYRCVFRVVIVGLVFFGSRFGLQF